jgi:hypothetical protein
VRRAAATIARYADVGMMPAVPGKRADQTVTHPAGENPSGDGDPDAPRAPAQKE